MYAVFGAKWNPHVHWNLHSSVLILKAFLLPFPPKFHTIQENFAITTECWEVLRRSRVFRGPPVHIYIYISETSFRQHRIALYYTCKVKYLFGLLAFFLISILQVQHKSAVSSFKMAVDKEKMYQNIFFTSFRNVLNLYW